MLNVLSQSGRGRAGFSDVNLSPGGGGRGSGRGQHENARGRVRRLDRRAPVAVRKLIDGARVFITGRARDGRPRYTIFPLRDFYFRTSRITHTPRVYRLLSYCSVQGICTRKHAKRSRRSRSPDDAVTIYRPGRFCAPRPPR